MHAHYEETDEPVGAVRDEEAGAIVALAEIGMEEVVRLGGGVAAAVAAAEEGVVREELSLAAGGVDGLEGDVGDGELVAGGDGIEGADRDAAGDVGVAGAVGDARVVEEGGDGEDGRGEAVILRVPDAEAVATLAVEEIGDLLLAGVQVGGHDRASERRHALHVVLDVLREVRAVRNEAAHLSVRGLPALQIRHVECSRCMYEYAGRSGVRT